MKITVIVNPRAGRGARALPDALSQADGAFFGAEVRFTTRPYEAMDLAKDAAAAGSDIVLAAGGDGTVNEVARGLIGSETSLGILPTGSGNGLGRTLGIPLDPLRALRALATAQVRSIDIGLVNGRPFLNVAGAGFDALVGAAFQRKGGRRGLFGYLELGFRESLSYRAETVCLEAAGERFDGKAFIVAFLNGRQYGAGAVVAPTACLDDGLLDVVVFEETSFLEQLAQVPRLFLGGIQHFRAYRHFAAPSAVLTCERPLRHHRDGEPEEAERHLEVRLSPKALKVLVPERVLASPEGLFQRT